MNKRAQAGNESPNFPQNPRSEEKATNRRGHQITSKRSLFTLHATVCFRTVEIKVNFIDQQRRPLKL